MILRWFLLAFACAICFAGFGQSYSFLSYSVAEGLPQSQVSSIVEDDKGYLWIGTLGGLGRFNGSGFVNFSTEEGLLNNTIRSLNYFDGQLWVGHEGGVSVISKGKIRKWAFSGEFKNFNVSAIRPFNKGIVIATNGGGLFFLNARNELRNISLSSPDENRVRGLLSDGNTLFVATRAGLLKTNDVASFIRISGAENLNISGIAKKEKNLVFSTFDQGIFEYNIAAKKLSSLGNPLVQTGVRNCIVDSRGNVWSASQQGVVITNLDGHHRSIDESKGLPLNAISVVFEDRNGTIWIGSEAKGLLRFPGEQFVYFNANNGIQSDLITAGKEISPGNYWFGTYDKGLIQYHRNSGFVMKPLPNNTLWSMETDRIGNVWLGSESGLFQYTPSGKITAYDEVSGTPGKKISTIYKSPSGDLWLGGSNGLSRISGGKIFRIEGSETNQDVGIIRNIVSFKGELLCAANGGLFSFKKGRYERYLGVEVTTFSLKTDQYDNLWIGTEEGLFWSDGNTLKKINLSPQPSSGFINFIDHWGDQLFVGTNNGLYVLSKLGLKSSVKRKHYGLEDGLINLESNINSSFVDRRGRLWFGTAQGLTVFDPNAELFDFGNILPFLNVKSLKLNFQDFNYSDYATSMDASGMPNGLVLPRSKNNLLIDLDGVTLKNSRDLRYQYWLEGLDETWSPEFSNPQVTLSNLPSGTYKLHVRARTNTGNYSKEYVLFIRVTPAFYATWWFFMLMFVVGVGVVVAIIQFRLRRERAKSYQETLEYKARLSSLEQQSLNASMNRHFIFNSLNSIQYFINTQDRVSANRYLTSFAKLIRKNLDSSSEDNNMVSLSQEIERLELYLSLESMRFRDRFDYEITVSDVDTESIMVPAMLFQPFVENSIIHGILPMEDRKGMISIRIEAKGNYLEVVLEDNGVGIDFSLNKKKQIDGDHKSQGMEITSKRIALLKKLSHQDFEMEGPFQLEDDNHSINGTRVLLKIPCENLEDQN